MIDELYEKKFIYTIPYTSNDATSPCIFYNLWI